MQIELVQNSLSSAGFNLNRFKVGARVAVLAAAMFALTLVAGCSAWWALSNDARQLSAFSDKTRDMTSAVELSRGAQVKFKIQTQEWKNILLRGGDEASFTKYSKAFAKEGDEVQAKLNQLKDVFIKLKMPAAQVAQVDELQGAMLELGRQYTSALTHYDRAEADKSAHAVDALVKGKDREPSKKIDQLVADITSASQRMYLEEGDAAQARMRGALLTLSTVMGGSLLLGSVLSVLVMRSVTEPISNVVALAEAVANGDLTHKVDGDGYDNEISALNRAMGKMSLNVSSVVDQVRYAADLVSNASSEISVGNNDLASRTATQVSNLQDAVASVGQLSSGVQNISDSAAQAHMLAGKSSDAAERGGTVVGQVVQTMSDIHESSRKISEIIGVIDGIAFQTNILALNAAVEAARAGEQGRGFAVVASEVRALAQRSANAAKEIKGLINASVECVARGADLVGEAGDTIASTVSAVQQVRDVISEIAVAAREQVGSIGQVQQRIGNIDNTMQQNAALAEESAATANSLQQQAEVLQIAIGFFKA